MKICILTIGNELMSGRTADTNSSFIAREINLQGWQVEAMMSVGDKFDSIKSRLNYLLALTDVVICTGGLGPTADDITTAAIRAGVCASIIHRRKCFGITSKKYLPNTICAGWEITPSRQCSRRERKSSRIR